MKKTYHNKHHSAFQERESSACTRKLIDGLVDNRSGGFEAVASSEGFEPLADIIHVHDNVRCQLSSLSDSLRGPRFGVFVHVQVLSCSKIIQVLLQLVFDGARQTRVIIEHLQNQLLHRIVEPLLLLLCGDFVEREIGVLEVLRDSIRDNLVEKSICVRSLGVERV